MVALTFPPAIAYLMNIKLGNPALVALPDTFAGLYAATDAHRFLRPRRDHRAGQHGFIISAMLWAAALVALVGAHAPRRASCCWPRP